MQSSSSVATLGAAVGASTRVWRTAMITTLALLCLYTAATVAWPAARVDVVDPNLRVVIEMVGLGVVLFAALVLAFPSDEDVRPARNTIVAGLCALAVSNVVFGVGPLLDAGAAIGIGIGLSFYPWVASRYVAGLLFIIGTLERPKLSLRGALLLAGALLVAADTVFLLLEANLPLPFARSPLPGFVVTVTNFAGHAAIEAVPAALFGVGAWLAGRLYRRTAVPMHLMLSLALAVQVFTHVHEVLYPALLGPRITSADVLRSLALLLLLLGALLTMRQLYLDQHAAVRAQEQDLRSQRALLDDLQAFAEREEDFRALVTHELATPIATLRAFAHVLSRTMDDDSQPVANEALAGIDGEARRLQQLVSRMEELRDLELAEFACDLRPTRVKPLLEDAARFARGLPGAHRPMIDCDDVRIHGDPVRLGQALRNLLSNAARYAPEGTPIRIEGRVIAGDRYGIAVTDLGPGIPASERRRLTRKYARGKTGRHVEGTGLGLYVARRIADAHGGRLEIGGDDPGGGARVVIQVRRAP